MIHAVTDFTGRLEPNELRSAFDRSINRTGFLAGANRLKYWDLYEQTYLAITDQGEGEPLPRIVRDELGKAYEQELSGLSEGSIRSESRSSH
jgi:predicted component of type VI protein secretion system